MSELVHADIFFFVTTVAVMLITTILAVALVYAISIMHDVRTIVARIRRASESLEDDFNALRHGVKEEGFKARALVDVVLGFISHRLRAPAKHKRARAAKPKKSEETTEEEH